MRKIIPLVVILGIVGVGCDSNTPAPSKEQEKSFQGGPMPKDFQEQLAKEQQQGAEKAQENAGAPK